MKELVDYFIQHTDQRFADLQREVRGLRSEIKALSAFKWKVVGIAVGVTAALNGLSFVFKLWTQ